MKTPLNNSQKNSQYKHISIFASGAGSNAKKIIERFERHAYISVDLIVCNKQGAGIVAIASQYNIPILLIEKERFFKGDGYLEELQKAAIDFIVLAGFLWKIPGVLIQHFKNKIINIHPALLPKYGGKGMYGAKVHEAVVAAHEKESGITIHYVDEHYDNGDVIFQATCPVLENDTAESLAEKIHQLEHKNYARVVEECINKFNC